MDAKQSIENLLLCLQVFKVERSPLLVALQQRVEELGAKLSSVNIREEQRTQQALSRRNRVTNSKMDVLYGLR